MVVRGATASSTSANANVNVNASHGSDHNGTPSTARKKNLFHWNLRSFHQHDESFRESKEHDYNQTAAEIFGADGPSSMSSSTLHESISSTSSSHGIAVIKKRTTRVDGKKLCFELRDDVTQKPLTDRTDRLKRSLVHTNHVPSHWEMRLRLWMIQFTMTQVTVAYLFLFIAMNSLFAGLFYAHPDKCCDDSSMTYGQVFDFAIQTSTTIGYGGYVPIGYYANFLVVLLSYSSILLNTLLAGLLFLKFVTPFAKIEFSDIMTLSNVNGLPCLQLRVGNCDGYNNLLTDVHVRFTYSFSITYNDEYGKEHLLGQTSDLKLLNDTRDHLAEVWTLRHVIDETSPLFGINFTEYPGTNILEFRATLTGTQDITKSPITAQAGYQVQDVLIGHCFQDQIDWDNATHQIVVDYAKMNETRPHPVWYPVSKSK